MFRAHPCHPASLAPAVTAAVLATSVLAATPQSPAFFPIDDVRPNMVGVGRTVFAGDAIEEFTAHIIGVIRNVNGPSRAIVLARLEGGPLARTGVIQGMSGSPVYVDGRLLGAVAYSLGTFPKEPLAGITPIGEMLEAAGSPAPPRRGAGPPPGWPASPADVFQTLARLAAPPDWATASGTTGLQGTPALARLIPTLRPIGVAMAFGGFEPEVGGALQRALGGSIDAVPGGGAPQTRNVALRPGDPVGMALMRGDLELGATGTVTHVDGARVYAFGHPFLNLGPTAMAMTRARVFTVIPSLDSSMKIAALGPVIGTMTQDRATGVAGILGTDPPGLTVAVTLQSDRAPERRLQFEVLHDQTLTPLFAYVAVLNALVAFERQSGALTIETTGDVSFGALGSVRIDDLFTGDGAAGAAAAAVTASVGQAATNEFRPALAERLNVTIRAIEEVKSTTIERVWLDTTRPRPGATHQLSVLLRDYRGGTETRTLPVTFPAHVSGAVTLFVGDAAALTALEDRDLQPGRPASWAALLDRMNRVRRNNRLYVRLLAQAAGTVVAGASLPALPGSVRAVFDDEKSLVSSPVARSVVGQWEQRVDRVVRGSRELPLTVTAR